MKYRISKFSILKIIKHLCLRVTIGLEITVKRNIFICQRHLCIACQQRVDNLQNINYLYTNKKWHVIVSIPLFEVLWIFVLSDWKLSHLDRSKWYQNDVWRGWGAQDKALDLAGAAMCKDSSIYKCLLVTGHYMVTMFYHSDLELHHTHV